MVPSNFELKVLAETKEQFELAMKLAFEAFNKASHWSVLNNKLYLYWHESKDTNKLPYDLNVNQAIEFVWGWLENQEPTGNEPNFDGSVHEGFKIENTNGYSFVSIEKVWTIYGK